MKVALLALVLCAGIAAAEGSGTGIGFILGEPTGLSVKQWSGPNFAVDGAAASSVLGNHRALHLHADLLWHSYIFPVTVGELPLYYGIGARVKLAGNNNELVDDDLRLGVRIPVGIEYLFDGAPLGAFLEAVPIVDLMPATGFNYNGAIGLRYYFR
jgi:hypothetical protein